MVKRRPLYLNFILFLSLVSGSTTINAFPFSGLSTKIWGIVDVLRWQFSSSYRKEESAVALKLLAEIVCKQNVLFKLNAIQLQDCILEEKEVMEGCFHPLNNTQIEALAKIVLGYEGQEKKISSYHRDQKIQENLQRYLQIIPETASCNSCEGIRICIMRRKFFITTSRGDLRYEGAAEIEFLLGSRPSREFIEELQWHKKQIEKLEAKKSGIKIS